MIHELFIMINWASNNALVYVKCQPRSSTPLVHTARTHIMSIHVHVQAPFLAQPNNSAVFSGVFCRGQVSPHTPYASQARSEQDITKRTSSLCFVNCSVCQCVLSNCYPMHTIKKSFAILTLNLPALVQSGKSRR